MPSSVAKVVAEALAKGSELRLTDEKGRQIIIPGQCSGLCRDRRRRSPPGRLRRTLGQVRAVPRHRAPGHRAAGFIVWANDKRHAKYGIFLPAGVAAAVGMLAWIICICGGPRLPAGPDVDAVDPSHGGRDRRRLAAVAVFLGRARARQDTQRLTRSAEDLAAQLPPCQDPAGQDRQCQDRGRPVRGLPRCTGRAGSPGHQ